MEAIAEEDISHIKGEVYTEALNHFYSIITGPNRFRFAEDASNTNIYGEVCIKGFLKICKHF
jgi:hypothetical protein